MNRACSSMHQFRNTCRVGSAIICLSSSSFKTSEPLHLFCVFGTDALITMSDIVARHRVITVLSHGRQAELWVGNAGLHGEVFYVPRRGTRCSLLVQLNPNWRVRQIFAVAVTTKSVRAWPELLQEVLQKLFKRCHKIQAAPVCWRKS